MIGLLPSHAKTVLFSAVLAALVLAVPAAAQEPPPAAPPEAAPTAPQEPPPRVSLQTSMGAIILELNRERCGA